MTNRNVAIAQSVLLCAFAIIFFISPGPYTMHSETARAAGAVLSTVGLGLMLSAIISLRRVIQVAPEPKAGGHLVTHGIYRFLRHPIYTAIAILVVGLFLRKPAVFVAAAAALTIMFLIIKVRIEEKLLLERYPEYVEYRKRTWGILPGL